MRVVLSLFLSALLLATSCLHAQTEKLPYQIDEQATAQAPWNVGDIITEDNIDIGDADMSMIYRKFIGMTNKGYFVVQDFYKESHKKASSPFIITTHDVVLDIPSVYIFDLFEGVQIAW